MTVLKTYTKVSGLLVVLLFVLSGQMAIAQSTIFNIPSTDTVAKGKGYVEFDFLPQIPKPDTGNRFYIYNPRILVGIAPNLEVGANFPMTHISPTTSTTFQPNLKYKFYNNDDSGVAASAGGVMITPINHREGVPTIGYVYGNLSKKVKSTYGPRFTAGPYFVTAKDEDFIGHRVGAILGYEQPVHPKVSIVADWFSEQNLFGYFTPGVSFTLPANGLLNIGYSLGNDSYKTPKNNNRSLFVYYGVTF